MPITTDFLPTVKTIMLRSLPLLASWLLSVVGWSQVYAADTAGSTHAGGQDDANRVATGQVAEWFERQVRPLLAEHCLSCHSSGLEMPKASLKLDGRDFVLAGGDSGPAVVAGNPDASLLMQAVRGEGLQMPPDKPLSKAEQTTLARWIRLGAPWPENEIASVATGPDWLISRAQTHWAWQPMREHAPPRTTDSTWPARPLDAFVLNKLEGLHIAPSPSASRTALLRRLTFDLTGLPPTAAQTLRFVSDDEDARNEVNAELSYSRLVDELLASPAFGVTWGRHWFDLVRYCETHGHEFDYPVRHAWRYRDAVIDSLNVDLSYAQFVSEHIAGDLATTPRRHPVSDVNQSLALTGWWWMGEGLHAPVDVWGDEATRLDNQIDVYSKTFLGLTIACARCHDHKFDALSAADYTSLVGMLQSSRRTYAFDDPQRAIATHNRSLAELRNRELDGVLEQQPGGETAQLKAFENWVDQFITKLREQLPEARSAIPNHHPLAPLLLLAEATTDAEFTVRRRALASQLRTAEKAFEDWRTRSPKIADFSSGIPSGWYVETPDARVADEAADPLNVFNAFDPVGILPTRPGTFTSHALGRQQQLTLRSPTFELTHPLVALRMRGKSAQTSIVVDNYFMNEFQGLLFGDLRKPIDQPNESGWVVHRGDLNKYIGHPAYVSIEDDENAWFELSEVRLTDSAPPDQPPATSLRLLSADTPTTADLRHSLASELAVAWSDATTRRASGARKSWVDGSKVELLRSAIAHGQRMELPLPLPTFDRAPLEALATQTPAPVRLIAMHEGTPRHAQLAIRGNPHTRGEVVPRRDLQALGGQLFEQPASSGRGELSASLTSRHHPLVARVMVNRVWLHLFGQGLVDSPDNFGLLGGAPSHSELLDFLTSQFIDHDWSIKWLVREICLSRAYRLSSRATPDQFESDPTSRMLSHRQVRRLSAEKLRDAMLVISGSIDRATSGESVPVHLSAQMTGRGRPNQSGPLDAFGRRSAFIEIRRNFLDPLLVAFDQPPPATTVGKRNLSNVPAQALSMLNDPLVHELAKRWSTNVAKEHADYAEQVQAMFLTALARRPTEQELSMCLTGQAIAGATKEESEQASEQASAERLCELAHVLFCGKEFLYLQ